MSLIYEKIGRGRQFNATNNSNGRRLDKISSAPQEIKDLIDRKKEDYNTQIWAAIAELQKPQNTQPATSGSRKKYKKLSVVGGSRKKSKKSRF
jgi:hypothetical protein